MKILAVDDDDIALSLLAETLGYFGYDRLTLCKSAAEALEIVAQDKKAFDCFLLDIQMPGMNGIELCRELRTQECYARTPIIMVTARSEKPYIDHAFAAGATDYITKPFDPLEVSVRLKLAGELGSERRYYSESVTVIDSLLKELDRTNRHDLEEAIEIHKSERVLSYPAFENYLLQLSRGVFFLTSIFAVKIGDIEKIHADLSPLQFRDFLGRAAKTIVANLRAHDVFVAYRGGGVFIGVMQRSGGRILKDLGGKVRIPLLDEDDAENVVSTKAATLYFGDPVISRILSKPGSLKHLCTAIDSAQGKLAKARQSAKYPGDFLPPPGEAKMLAETAMEYELRREYDQILRAEFPEDLAALTQTRKKNRELQSHPGRRKG